jgi:hypothetical protein
VGITDVSSAAARAECLQNRGEVMKKIQGLGWGLVRALITAAIFCFIFSRIDGVRFRQTIEKIHLGIFAAAALWLAATNSLDAVVCRRILARLGIRLRFLEVLRVNYWAYFFSLLGGLPGAVSRVIGLSGSKKKTTEAFAAILVERYFKLCVTYLFFLLGFYYRGNCFGLPERNIILTMGLCLGLLLLCILFFFFIPSGLSAHRINEADDHGSVSMGVFFKRHWSRLRVVMGCLPAVRQDWLVLFPVLILQALMNIGAFLLLSWAVEVPFGFLDALWIASFVGLVEMIPITICGLGIREGVLIYLLSRYGIIAEKGLALGLSWFVVGVLLGLAGGVWFLWGAGRRAAEEA